MSKNLFFLLFSLSILHPAKAQYTWKSYTIGKDASLRGIAVLDEKTVWVSGSHNTIAKTENGGRTWQLITIPDTEGFDFRDIEIFSKKEVLVMSAGEGISSNIYRTTDGGLSWKNVLANTDEKGFYDGFAFWTEKEGILGGDPVDGKLFLMKTNDAGLTWSRISPAKLPAMKKGEIGGFAASGSHLTVAANSVWVGTGGAVARIFYSNDRGKSWRVMKTPMIQGAESQGIFSIDFYNKKKGVAVGGDFTKETVGDQNVILTNDGGKNWLLPEQFPVYQSAVRFVNPHSCVSVGPAATYYSVNGGKDWRKIPGKGYHTMSIGRDGSLWAAGREGSVGKLKL